MDDETDKIQGRNVEDQSVHGAEIKYDILFDAKLPNSEENEKIGLFINIEAQNSSNTPYPILSRAVYYCSRLLAKQKNMQGGFQNSEFQNLKKVYSIWIVMNSNKAMEGVLNKYTITEECLETEYRFPKEDYDKLSIVMIYPKREYDIKDNKNGMMKMLNLLFKAKMPAEDKKYQLSKNYGIMMTRAIDEVMDGMCDLSKGVREEGRVEGLAEAVTNIMKTMNKTMDEAMNLSGVDEAIRSEVEKAIKAMNRQTSK